MNKRLLTLLLVLLFSALFLNIAFAENNTTETIETNSANYIKPISISQNGIDFTDSFTGFCLDSSKDSPTADDGFTQDTTTSDETENYVKLAIIECYRQGRENDIGEIIAKIVDGDLDTTDSVINEILNSYEKIGDKAVVNIDNTTEATFDFELLKSASENTSDCLAYTVSLKTVEVEEPLTAAENATEDAVNEDNSTAQEVQTQNDTDESQLTATENNDPDESQKAASENNDTDNALQAQENDTDKATKIESNTVKNDSDKTAKTKNTKNESKKSDDNKDDTVVNEKNKTIINKTNTVIINENNTTVINHNNVKTINKTTHETPHENTTGGLLKDAGNPIFILIVVIAIIAVAAVVMNRKD